MRDRAGKPRAVRKKARVASAKKKIAHRTRPRGKPGKASPQASPAAAAAGLRRQLAALKAELGAARQQQGASGDILRAISRSSFDLQQLLETLTVSAAKLCDADMSAMARRRPDGDYHHVTAYNFPADWVEYNKSAIRLAPGRGSVVGRVLLERRAVQVADVLADPEYTFLEPARKAGFRTFLGVPLMRDGEPAGILMLGRRTVRPFTEAQIALLATFADQAVIAMENTRLFDELQGRTRELGEALERQTATADVLKVISRSAFDLEAVLRTLVESAARLCEADIGTIRFRDGEGFRLAATYGCTPEWQDHFARYSVKPDRGSVFGRTIIEGRVVHLPDVLADPEFARTRLDAQKLMGFRAALGVPLLREGGVLGVINLFRSTPRSFTEKQIELVSTFADQAVIAIENARLFGEVQARTVELSESLQQQTATNDVLKVISRSAFDLQAVLQTLVQSAAQLCNAELASVTRPRGHGDAHYHVASVGFAPEWLENMQTHPLVPERGTLIGRALLEARTVHIPDVLADPEYTATRAQQLGKFRAILGVPLLRDGIAIGVFMLARSTPQQFTNKQIELASTFADQAVIAIENARLFGEVQARTVELSESLQQQTATSEILASISNSMTDAQPVFDTIVRSLLHLFGTQFAAVQLLRDGMVHMPAAGGAPGFERLKEQFPRPLDDQTIGGQAILLNRTLRYSPVLDNPDAPPATQRFARQFGFNSVLFTPIARGGEVIGSIGTARSGPEPFDEKQVALIRAFADQAVIAVQNGRLFNEVQERTRQLTESLEQQTATADVLKVISRSTFDLQMVLDTLLESATRLCDAEQAWLLQRDGDEFHWTAGFGLEREAYARLRDYFSKTRVPVDRGSITGRTALEGKVVHVVDVLEDSEYAYSAAQQIGGYRAALGVPLLRQGEVVGVIFVSKTVPRPFTAKQIDLVTTFADQALIAIENGRLLSELRESLQQQTATADVLKVISRSTFDLQTVLQTLVESAARLCDADQGTITRQKDRLFYRTAAVGFSTEFLESVRALPVEVDRSSATGRALHEGRIVHIGDIQTDPDYTFGPARELGGFRTVLAVPMLREGIPIGVLALTRVETRPFTEKQIELVSTFADQAAIAIENVRLFDSVEARTRELGRSLEELRAAQDRLVQTEKLASLGQLTAGIAHEIKNPLNFVNNFSSVSVELVDELRQALAPAVLDDAVRAEVDELTGMLCDNLAKVVQHGRRADSIVKNMLLHSREGAGDRRPVDINNVVEESLNLAYHGARAERPGFNITLERSLDPDAGQVDLFPQEITRVLLNLISNGFYAAGKRKALAEGDGYEPSLAAATRNLGDRVEITIRDNGTGIPPEIREKIFNPFFTTKPAGEGTGLGLSLSHDIVVKQHAGTIEVESEPGRFTLFRIVLPRGTVPAANTGDGA